MNDYTFINAWVVMCLSNDPYATERQWHKLLHRCPLRNLLINGVVYVSGKTSLCQGTQQRLRSEEWWWRDRRRGRQGWLFLMGADWRWQQYKKNTIFKAFCMILQGSYAFSFKLCGLIPSFSLLHNLPPQQTRENLLFSPAHFSLCNIEGHELGLLFSSWPACEFWIYPPAAQTSSGIK